MDKTMYVDELPFDTFKKVENAVLDRLEREDLSLQDRMALFLNAMNGRVCDLEDTIDIKALGF